MYKNEPVYVTGVGMISALGNTLEQFFDSLNEVSLDETNQQKMVYGNQEINAKIYEFEAYQRNAEDYFLDMCCNAINAAIKDCKNNILNKKGCILLGTGMGMADLLLKKDLPFDFMSELSTKLQSKLQLKIKVVIISNACCAGAQAIAYAKDLLNQGEYHYVIAGGAEMFSFITYCGFKRLNAIDMQGCKPFDHNRRGISVGDGAAFFVFEKQNENGAYCSVSGHYVTNDAYHIVSPREDGSQILLAMEKAVAKAGITPEDIQAVIAHGTGTVLNDLIEAQALHKLFGEIDVTAPKGKLGHTGGASGAFGLVTAIGALYWQYLPPVAHFKDIDDHIHIKPVSCNKKRKELKHVLVNCFAFGGTNVSFICSRTKYEL